MKRDREERELTSLTVANCLMLLSRPEFDSVPVPASRVFECRTCHRQFPSFQALGGHRASHKKQNPPSDAAVSNNLNHEPAISKPKMHECSICGEEFSMGQALGGHMRRHRSTSTEIYSKPAAAAAEQFVRKKTNSSSGGILCLDLNLTPLENYRFVKSVRIAI